MELWNVMLLQYKWSPVARPCGAKAYLQRVRPVRAFGGDRVVGTLNFVSMVSVGLDRKLGHHNSRNGPG